MDQVEERGWSSFVLKPHYAYANIGIGKFDVDEPDVGQFSIADMNDDGALNIQDIILIINVILFSYNFIYLSFYLHIFDTIFHFISIYLSYDFHMIFIYLG